MLRQIIVIVSIATADDKMEMPSSSVGLADFSDDDLEIQLEVYKDDVYYYTRNSIKYLQKTSAEKVDLLFEEIDMEELTANPEHTTEEEKIRLFLKKTCRCKN